MGIKQFHLVCRFIDLCLYSFWGKYTENSLGTVVMFLFDLKVYNTMEAHYIAASIHTPSLMLMCKLGSSKTN